MVVPSGDTRPSADADADAAADAGAGADADADVSSDSAVLRVIILFLREYCFVPFSSLLMKGDKVCGCASI